MLESAVHELTTAARHTISLSDHIRENPLLWLAGGLVVGIWLGTRATPPPPQIVIASEGDLR